jgi:hypothetical protein
MRSFSSCSIERYEGHTGADGSLRSCFLHLSSSTIVHDDIVATLLQGISAVGERALVGVQVFSTFCGLLRMFLGALAWMSDDLLRKQSSSKKASELHD